VTSTGVTSMSLKKIILKFKLVGTAIQIKKQSKPRNKQE
jgi:hypothetical protein